MKLKKVILSSVVMIGIFSCTASFATSASWNGRLPGNYGNLYTDMVTKSTNNRTAVAIAKTVPNSGIRIKIHKDKGSGALAASDAKTITKAGVKTNITYHSYYTVGNQVRGAIENRSSGPLGFSSGTIDLK